MSATSSRVAVPDIGDFDQVPIIEILVSVGDTVAAEDPLVTLESDKATMDVPAPYDGVVREILVSVGDTVAEGAELMVVEPATGDTAAAEAPAPAAAPVQTSEPGETASPAPPADEPAAQDAPTSAAPPEPDASPAAANGDGPIYASPSARRLARERQLDISALHG
ncbi:MAG: biotin/lipoyl-containing protein, partial [Solirubrobacteraceae bacterium]